MARLRLYFADMVLERIKATEQTIKNKIPINQNKTLDKKNKKYCSYYNSNTNSTDECRTKKIDAKTPRNKLIERFGESTRTIIRIE